jgi:hypothetical protein
MRDAFQALLIIDFSAIVWILREQSFQPMRFTTQFLSSAILVSALTVSAGGQTFPPAANNVQEQLPLSTPAVSSTARFDSSTTPVPHAVEELLGFKESDVKFDLRSLMEILRDRRHEGWVLAAYPDPKTSRPLIGAGVSLDLPERDHPQRDPLNSHPFIEPSSAELWQAAGLDSERLQAILDQFHDRLTMWSSKGFRKNIKTLPPQITDEEATLLLRVSAIQAIYNAKGYCRDFDRLTASQQMALSQLVYQMGVNLEEFHQFLDLINGDFASSITDTTPLLRNASAADAGYWKTVQQSLIMSQWARLYRGRAVAVIAMLDPRYRDEPATAERRVGAMLRPAVAHRRPGRSLPSPRLASYSGRSTTARKAKLHSQRKRGI